MKATVVTAPSAEEFSRRLAEKGAGWTLAIIFAGHSHDYDAVRKAADAAGLDVFGAGSAGEIAMGAIFDDTIVAALLDLPRDAYRVRCFPAIDLDMDQLGREVGEWAAQAFPSPGVMLHMSGFMGDGRALLDGVHKGVGRKVPVCGGRAGSMVDIQRTFCFDRHTVIDGGVTALVLDQSKVEMAAIAASGWNPIGFPKTITKVDGHVIHELDGERAVDVVGRYLDLQQDILLIGAQHPLHIQRADGTAVLRSIFTFDRDAGTVTIGGQVAVGDKCSFTVSSGLNIKDTALKEAAALKEEIPEADLVIMYSCVGRCMALGPWAEDEVAGIESVWNAPNVGFFTFGEFGCYPGHSCDYHNDTCVIVALRAAE